VRCKCGGDTRVVDARVLENGVRRRRLCMDCGFRFSTLESVLPEKVRELKPTKNKSPFTPKEVAEQIRKKKLTARRGVEDTLIAREDADIFNDVEDDEDIQWTSSL